MHEFCIADFYFLNYDKNVRWPIELRFSIYYIYPYLTLYTSDS